MKAKKTCKIEFKALRAKRKGKINFEYIVAERCCSVEGLMRFWCEKLWEFHWNCLQWFNEHFFLKVDWDKNYWVRNQFEIDTIAYNSSMFSFNLSNIFWNFSQTEFIRKDSFHHQVNFISNRGKCFQNLQFHLWSWFQRIIRLNSTQHRRGGPLNEQTCAVTRTRFYVLLRKTTWNKIC